MDNITRAHYAAGVAIHEASHLVAAESCGFTLRSATLDTGTLEGAAYWRPEKRSPSDAVAMAAGAVGHARYLGRRNWKAFLSDHDRAKLVESARHEGEHDVEKYIDRAGQRAKELLSTPAAWRRVRSFAVRLLESGGKLELDAAPSKTGFARLQESSARLLRKEYP